MKSVFKEILWKNNFASIAGLGSFVCTYTPARLSPNGDQFIPPSQTVSFDTSRTFNDEALERYLQDKFGLRPSEATELANNFVEKVKNTLNKGEAIVFDNLGELSRDQKGGLLFKPVDELILASSTYGLKTLTLNEKVAVDVASANTKVSKKSSLRLLYGIAAAVVIVGMFLSVALIFFSDFLVTNDNPPELLSTKTPPKVEPASEGVKMEHEEIASVQEKDKQESVDEDHVAQSVSTKNDKKQALFYQETENTTHKYFYIISGSYGSLENAEKHFNQLLSKGFRPEIIQGNGRYRVAMVKFSDRNIALRELDRIRQQNPSSSFWLLGI